MSSSFSYLSYLKSGNELFVYHICDFQLKKNSENIKNCLTKHRITPKLAATNNLKTKEEVKALLKTDDLRNAYDEFVNLLYDTTDSEKRRNQ